MNWLVQSNLIREEVTGAFEQSCKELGHKFCPVKIIPFTDSIEFGFDPFFRKPQGKFIPYGSTSMIKLLNRAKLDGCYLYFDHENLKTSKWIDKLGDRILNSDAKIMKLSEAMKLEKGTFFMKPDDDLKDFCGSIVDAEGIKKFYDEVSAGGFCFSPDIDVVLSPIKDTGFEYRFFMIHDYIISCSSYKLRSQMIVDEPVPYAAMKFAKDTAKIWHPQDVHVMDVVDVGGEYKVIEFNCFNASGFYNCDLNKIIREVSDYVHTK